MGGPLNLPSNLRRRGGLYRRSSDAPQQGRTHKLNNCSLFGRSGRPREPLFVNQRSRHMLIAIPLLFLFRDSLLHRSRWRVTTLVVSAIRPTGGPCAHSSDASDSIAGSLVVCGCWIASVNSFERSLAWGMVEPISDSIDPNTLVADQQCVGRAGRG